MTNINDPSSDGSSHYEDYWIIAFFLTKEKELWDDQIGEVTLPKDLAYDDMPFELEINGVTYVKE